MGADAVSYTHLFGRPFSVSTDDREYGDILNGIFDQKLRKKMKNLCKEAVVKGIGWLQPYIDKEGIHFEKIPAEEVIPIWGDAEHAVLEAAVRVYTSEGYEEMCIRDRVRQAFEKSVGAVGGKGAADTGNFQR